MYMYNIVPYVNEKPSVKTEFELISYYLLFLLWSVTTYSAIFIFQWNFHIEYDDLSVAVYCV